MITQNVKNIQNYQLPFILKEKEDGENSGKKVETPKSYCMPDADLMKVYFAGIKNKTVGDNSNKNKLGFGVSPSKINFSDYGISEKGSIIAAEAMQIFELFKNGSYLDLNGGVKSASDDAIRAHNLSFLDRVTETNEKRKFVMLYKKLTGFPDLKEVSVRIYSEFVKAVKKAESYSSDYKVVIAGYDGVCSVAKGKALPGSDLDKAYVVIKGSSDYADPELVNRFKGHLWNNTDQRILSYNHDDAAFPHVYTVRQIEHLLDALDSRVSSTLVEKIETPTAFFDRLMGKPKTSIEYDTSLFDRSVALMDNYHEDYTRANPFFIKLCKNFPIRNNWKLDINNPSRENIYDFGYFIESLVRGDYFPELLENGFAKSALHEKIQNSAVSALTNLSQIEALRKRSDAKPKRLARERLETESYDWSWEKQYRFVTTMIKGSCANNKPFTIEFPEYFSGVGQVDRFKSLMDAIGVNGSN